MSFGGPITWGKLPLAMPGGEMVPHMSARARTQMVDALFEASGGFQKALDWIEKSDENYGEFLTKIWAKGVAKATVVEHGLGDGVEALLAQLDGGAHARVISPQED